MIRNVRDYGAKGDGATDDTKAIAAAAAASDPLVLYLPAGEYRVTAWPSMPDYSRIYGDGEATTVVYEGDSTLIALRDKQRIAFERMAFFLTGTKGTLFRLSNCFRCSFDGVVLRGNHTSDNYPTNIDQRGVVLDDNTGGTSFVNCDINNFGYGLVTSCIQNYVAQTKFATNRIGVLGTGSNDNAGLSLTNVEFTSDQDPRTTDKHIDIDGPANDWWLTNVWFEGAEVAVSVGRAGVGGPSQFGMINCKIAARTSCLDLNHCRQPYLANIIFDQEASNPPAPVRVNVANCWDGTAVGLISGTSTEVSPSLFPAGWLVNGRSRMSGLRVAGRGSNDILNTVRADGSRAAAILKSGAVLVESPAAGVILADSGGKYWRVTVSTTGALQTTSLGSARPSA